jgi:acetyl-CoA acetyltransferase
MHLSAKAFALRAEFGKRDGKAVDQVLYGCVNQAGEGDPNVARMHASGEVHG